MKKSFLLITLLIFLFSASQAMSQEQNKFYLGISGSKIYENFDEGVNAISFSNSSNGINFKLGYILNEKIQAELEYLLIDEFDVNIAGIRAFDLDGYAVTASAKYYLETEKIKPYAIAGAGFADFETTRKIDLPGVDNDQSDCGVILKAGFGIDYQATDNIILFTEGSYYFTCGNIDGLDFYPISIGLKYLF